MVLVTGKGSHDLRVFDGATGALMEPIGHAGSGAGQFLRPNGVRVVQDFALVVERDNRRIPVLGMPGGAMQTCQCLIAAANAAGGSDNITAIVAQF